MILTHPGIGFELDSGNDAVNTLVIENPKYYYEFISDLYGQSTGFDGKAVISKDGKILEASKYLDLIIQMIPFEINRKSLLNRIGSRIEDCIASGDYYLRMTELLGELTELLFDVSFDLNCNLEFDKMSIGSVIKASGFYLRDDYESLAEKIIDYMELVREFDRDKLFITVNMRDYISDREAEGFVETVLSHEFSVIMIESHERERLAREKRFVIDKDLCEIIG